MIVIRFFKALFGIYAFLIFITTLLLVTPIYIFIFLAYSETKSPHIAHRVISRSWARVLTWVFFTPAKIINTELIDPKKTYVFVASHRSQLDIPLYALSNKNTIRFLAKAELTKIPLLGFIIKKLYLSVNRADRADRNRSFEIMRNSLNQEISVFLCPEGTRNRHEDPPLLDFRDGAFRLAILTKTPIAALTVLNTGEKLSPNHAIELAPGTLYAIWDEPIETSHMTLEDLPALKEKVREQMISHLMKWKASRHSANGKYLEENI